MNIKIYAKSAYDRQQIKHRFEIGADGIELYTDSPLKDIFFYDDNFDLLPFEYLRQINIIHMPLHFHEEDFNNFGIDTLLGQNVLRALSKKVNMLQKITERNVGIVCHIERDKEYLINQPESLAGSSILFMCNSVNNNNLWNKMIIFFQELAKEYPNITYYIENSALETVRNPETHLEFVKEVGLKNVKLCVNICHLQITKYYKSIIFNDTDKSILEYLKSAKNNLGLIHLGSAANDKNGFGQNKGHGCDFNYNKALLRNILEYIYTENLNIPIVLNVKEDDYTQCNNYKNLREQILSIERENGRYYG